MMQSRFSSWFGTTVLSLVALVALHDTWDGGADDQDKNNKWAFSAIVISLGFSALGTLAHVARDKFVGTPVEVGLATIILAMWCGALPTIMHPEHNLATDIAGGITNANLYFSSWGAFFMTLFVHQNFVSDVYKVGQGTTNTGFGRSMWLFLAASGFIVMSSASRIYKIFNCSDLDDIDRCDRLGFAVGIGAISAILGLVWMALGARCHKMIDGVMSLVMVIIWVFGVIFITFGGPVKAPAHDVGNLYFSTWICFVTSCYLVAGATRNMFGSSEEAETTTEPQDNKKEDVVEEGGAGADEEEPTKDHSEQDA